MSSRKLQLPSGLSIIRQIQIGLLLESAALTPEDALRQRIEEFMSTRPGLAEDEGYAVCGKQQNKWTMYNERGIGNLKVTEYGSLEEAKEAFNKACGSRLIMHGYQEVCRSRGSNPIALHRVRRQVRLRRGEKVGWSSYVPDVVGGIISLGGIGGTITVSILQPWVLASGAGVAVAVA